MSDNTVNRLYRIGKSYLDQVRNRIETWDEELARRELEAETGPGPGVPGGAGGDRPARDDSSAEAMMRRAEERIRAANARVGASGELKSDRAEIDTAAAKADPNVGDYRILGVDPGADWTAVQAAYEKLTRRCDPTRFPEGSTEQKEAARILERVNVAYEALRKRLDPTENRFARLEF